MVRWLIAIALFLSLTACSSNVANKQLVQQAIALQLEQTQQQLSQKLGVPLQGLEVAHVKVTQCQPIEIQSLPAYHVLGTYDLTLKLPRKVTQHNSFNVYLQRQPEGKTWRLLIPQKDQATWLSYLIR